MNTSHSPLQIPPYYCPIPPLRHPDSAAFDEKSVKFLSDFGLHGGSEQLARLSAGMGGVAGYIAPRGGPDGVQLVSDLAAWAIAIDDVIDEGPLGTRPGELVQVMARLQRTIEAPELPVHDDPFASALRDVRLRMDSLATPFQVALWAEAMRGYFYAEAQKACNLTCGLIPALSDFVVFRLYSAASLSFPRLVHIAEGIPLTPAAWADRRIPALTEMAASVGIWQNDIFSYAKDSHRSGDGHNLIDVLRNERGCSTDQALVEATAMCDRVMCRFLQLSKEVTAQSDTAVSDYVRGLGHYIRGFLDWSLASDRYVYLSGVNGGARAFAEPGERETPSDDSAQPLPVASIAWWWAVGGPEKGTQS